MTGLSERLKRIEDMVPSGTTVADIGTDHGYLPMDLMAENIAKHVILCDVNDGPLEKARMNLANAGFNPAFWDIRKGDGLGPLQTGEAEVIVIAGMGGLLIRDILNADPKKTEASSLYLLQPRTETGTLRKWLFEKGWTFEQDVLVRERQFICEILAVRPPNGENGTGSFSVAFPGEKERDLFEKLEWEVSPYWFSRKEPLAGEYLDRMLEREKHIGEEASKGTSPESVNKRERSAIRFSLLQEYKNLLITKEG